MSSNFSVINVVLDNEEGYSISGHCPSKTEKMRFLLDLYFMFSNLSEAAKNNEIAACPSCNPNYVNCQPG